MKDKIKSLMRKAGYIKSNGKANWHEIQFDTMVIGFVTVLVWLVFVVVG